MVLDIQLMGTTYDNASVCFTPSFSPAEQVACSAQHLNITDPRSDYDFEHYPFLWEPIACMLANVTYEQRVNIPDNFNWCSVPLAGSDAFLFVSLALLCAGCLFGKLSAVWVLIAGGVVGCVNNYLNLLHVSNAIAIWLGISPPDLFFFAFLPPLLVDSAIRIDFFMFSKLWVHIVLMAFVMVVLTAVILTPIILFVLGFADQGFTWVHGALFAAMIASTDALAATAILKQGGGPEKLVVLMEGEALLNDASAITLFEVFMHILEASGPTPTVWEEIPVIILETLKLASIGAGVGLAMSILTGYLLRWVRWRGARPPVEITIILAVAYLSFYVGQSPAQGSGVISVVIYGLWGNYTSKWGMLASAEESGAFDAFWDTLSFASNGLVFFWAGIASMNYFLRSVDILQTTAWSYIAIPLIYLFMMLIRTACLSLFNLTVFRWVRERLSWAEVVFTGWGGLRGAISLIMTADFIAHSAFLQSTDPNDPDYEKNQQLDRVNSDIALWTAAFVLLTLLINAPSISMVMHWLRLDRIPPEKQAMRAKAKRALMRFTGAAIDTLREDGEEFLEGANWEAVAAYVDISGALKKFDPPPPPPPTGGAAVATGRRPSGVAPVGKEGLKQTVSTEAAMEVAADRPKSMGQILLSPFTAAAGYMTSTGAGHKQAAASDAAAAAEEGAAPPLTANGGSGVGAAAAAAAPAAVGGLLGGLLRSASFHQLALGGGAAAGAKHAKSKEQRLDRKSSHGQLNCKSSRGRLERKSSRGDRSHRSRKSGYATDSESGSEYDSDASTSSLGSGHSSDAYGSGGSAGLMLGEVVEECPFIDDGGKRGRDFARRSSRRSLSSEASPQAFPEPPPHVLNTQQQQQQQQHQGADIELGLRRPGRGSAGAEAAVATAAAAAAATTAAAATAKVPAAAAGGAATKQAAGTEEGSGAEDGMSEEELAFMRQVQARQRQQSQHRPALGALFDPASDSEQPPAGQGQAPADGTASGSTFRRPGSYTQLQTITEHRPQAAEQAQQQGWHQVPGAPGSAASEGGGAEDLYYSSVPAALGRQMQAQLRQQLAAADGRPDSDAAPSAGAAAAAAAMVATTAATAAAAMHSGPSGGVAVAHAHTSLAEELYYSSVPAAMGRQMQQQLQKELMATPQHSMVPGPAAAASTGAPSTAGSLAALAEAQPETEEITASGPASQAGDGSPLAADGGYYSSVPAAVGRHLQRQLQQELAAAAAAAGAGAGATPKPEAPSAPASPRIAPSGAADYYSSVPAAVGRRMAEQFQRERASAAASAAASAEQPAAAMAAPEAEVPDAEPSAGYYSSLPAAAGRNLQRQLQQELAAAVQRQKQAAAGAAAAVAATAAATTVAVAVTDRAVAGEAAAADHYSTMPATTGRSLQRELALELQKQHQQQAAALQQAAGDDGREGGAAAAAARGGGRETRRPPRPSLGSVPPSSSAEPVGSQAAAAAVAAGVHPAPPRPAARAIRAPPMGAHRPAWEEYHATVMGTAGPSLAAELKRQLAQRKAATAAGADAAARSSAATMAAMPQRDLLGRKVAHASVFAAAATTPRPGGGEEYFRALQLSAGGSYHARLSPTLRESASVLPAATPVSAKLQIRRARTLATSRRTGTADAAAAAVSEVQAAGGSGGRDDTLKRLQRRSGSWPVPRDTSWQHKPLKAVGSTGHGHGLSLSRASANIAASMVTGSEDGGGRLSPRHSAGSSAAAASAAGAATLLSRTYSGPTVSPLGGGMLAGTAMQRGHRALQRYSTAGSAGSREASMHGEGGYAAMAMNAAGAGSPDADTPASPGDLGGGTLSPDGTMSAGALSEMRSRLIAGLKRYFHSKRMEGLLSSQGLRILDYACDHAAEHTGHKLGLWELLEKEVKGNLSTRFMAHCLMLLARTWRAAPRWLQTATSWPVKKMSGFLRRMLGQRMLVSCEVAVEYYLSMLHSPQISWMQQTDEAWPLHQEVEGEVDAAYRFIIDREIEAPDRFGAIQSYRAAMAVLRQQLTFVHELYESGMVDKGEQGDMLAPLDKRMRHLEITGPVWKPPRPRVVLRSLPFMQALPDEVFKWILRAGSIKEYRTGHAFWSGTDVVRRSHGESGPGAFVVLSGVIRRQHVRPDGTTKEYFQGVGGVVGSLLALTGTRLRGSDAAVAEGNTLGKGPMLFHLPQSAVRELLQRADAGDHGALQLRRQLMRLAGAFVVESCETDVVEAVQHHLVLLASAKADRSPQWHSRRHGSRYMDGGSPRAVSGGARLFPADGADTDGSAEEEAAAGAQLPTAAGMGPRHSTSYHRQAAALVGEVDEGQVPGKQQQQQQQQQQMSPAPSGLGLRHSKSFGGHLAELMQQIAQEEFEELGGSASQHVEQVEEGDEGEDLASPAGGSAGDPPNMAAGVSAGQAASNGYAPHHAGSLGRRSGQEQLRSGKASALSGRAARAVRQRIKAAARRAPQKAAEVMADIKRGLPTSMLLELPAGAPFHQTTHAVLLRGQLHAAQPAALSLPVSPRARAHHTRSASADAFAAAGSGSAPGSAAPSLHRASLAGTEWEEAAGRPGWAETVAATDAALASPEAPRILPWLWSPRFRCNAGARLATEQEWVAGAEGALLLVCLGEDGEVPAGVGEAQYWAAEERRQAAAARDTAAAALKSAPPVDALGAVGAAALGGGGMVGAASAEHASTQPRPVPPHVQRASSLLRMMPWQHRMARKPAPAPTIEEAPPAGDGSPPASSPEGSGHGQERLLRVPLERLSRMASGRSSAADRSVQSAR